MNDTRNDKRASKMLPNSTKGWLLLTAVIVVAFVVGIFSSSNNENMAESDSGRHVEAEKATIWTCSMHPQIRLPHPGKCPICFMDLIPLESNDDGSAGPRELVMTEAAIQLASIRTAPVVRGTAAADISMVGRIAYDESTVSYITAWVAGRIDRMYADYTGIKVSRGDHMVQMYSPELISAQEELIQAKKTSDKMTQSDGLLKSTIATTLDAAREKLRLLGLTDSQIEQIESSGTVSDQLTLYAPVGGVVVSKEAKEGMYVKTGARLYTIADLSRLWVEFDAYESDLPWLKDGQKVSFTTISLPGENFQGTISFIDPILNEKTRTVRIRAIVDNKDGHLKPDMFVSGIVQATMKAKNVAKAGSIDDKPLLIPGSAPLITGKRAVVYVQLPDKEKPTFEGREVTLGSRVGDFMIVKEGLTEGEMVVVNGAFKIDAELEIQAKPSMMNPAGGAVGTDRTHNHHEMKEASLPAANDASTEAVSNAARKALKPLYETYLDLQERLAGDDFEKARELTKKLAAVTKQINMELFAGDAHMTWMKLSSTIIENSMAASEAADMAGLRERFKLISDAVIAMGRNFGHIDDDNYYVTFCPMAFDNTGAFWIQRDTVINNAYFGSKMPRCGSIKDTLVASAGQK